MQPTLQEGQLIPFGAQIHILLVRKTSQQVYTHTSLWIGNPDMPHQHNKLIF